MLKLKLASYLEQKKQRGTHRVRRKLLPMHSKKTLNFSSNDYLGLTQNPNVQRAYLDGFRHYPVGSTGSALVSGYHATHEALEHAFSDALGVDAAILFQSGFAANLSLMNLLA